MNPIYPQSVWIHKEYGTIVVVVSLIMDNGFWEVTFADTDRNTTVIETNLEEWMRDTQYVCTLEELGQTYGED